MNSETEQTDLAHPRTAATLIGHEAAERALLEGLNAKRLPHAWLISGPEGIGKATLAYRFARIVLDQPPEDGGGLFGETPSAAPPLENLAMAEDHPIFRRVASGSHGDLLVIERGYDEKRKTMRSAIIIDDVRKLANFFGKTSSEGGWRVAVIDSVDELNRNSSNALLKNLEEPPDDCLLLLISHSPGKVLPTIRSRCRQLALSPLPDEAVVSFLKLRIPNMTDTDAAGLAALAGGAPGKALKIAEEGGLELYRVIIAILSKLPNLDIEKAHALADRLARKDADGAYQTFMELLSGWLSRLVRTHAAGDSPVEFVAGEKTAAKRLLASAPPGRWIDVWENILQMKNRAEAINLDRKQVVLSTLDALQSASRGSG